VYDFFGGWIYKYGSGQVFGFACVIIYMHDGFYLYKVESLGLSYIAG
jgi:hypothetical protein